MDPVALSKVKVGPAARSITPIKSRGVLLNAADAERWITKRKHLLGYTYTFRGWFLYHFDKLIVGNVFVLPNEALKKIIRFASNSHIKCYIDKREMLVGSFNLTDSIIEDLCVVIKDQSLIAHMRIQFNKHWKAL